MRCRACVGTGEVLGGGFMLVQCGLCSGNGYIDTPNVVSKEVYKADVVSRYSKSYKDAIKALQELHPDLSRQECVKIFDDAYRKV